MVVLSVRIEPLFMILGLGIGGVMVTAVESWLLLVVLLCWRDSQHPLSVAIAFRSPILPWWLQPIIMLWWLVHFVAGVWLAASLSSQTSGEVIALFSRLLFFGMAFGMTCAANAFLLLAASALSASHETIWRIWRWRLAIDALVALVGASLVPYVLNR